MATKKKKVPNKKESKVKKKPPTLKQQEDELEITLPSKKNKPSSEIEDYNFLIYGPKGVGKTSLASEFEDSITMQFEPGGKALTTFQQPCPTWVHFRKSVKMLEKDPSLYRNIVVDTAQLAYDKCMDYVCEENGFKHPSEEAWGAGWKKLSNEFNSTMSRAGLLGLGFFAICHDQDKEIETHTGRKFHKCMPNLSGQAESFFSGPIDVVGYYHYVKNERWLLIRGNDYIEAKCRLQNNFIALDGNPVHMIPMGNSPEESYDNLLKAFNNEQEESFLPDENKVKKNVKKGKKKKKKLTIKKRNK